MIASFLIALCPTVAPAPVPSVLAPSAVEEDDFTRSFESAKADVGQLWELHKTCKAEGKIAQARECLNRIIELDSDHEDARKALGHHPYDGKWFKSYYELSEYKRAEEKRMLEEKGLVRFRDDWVPEADLPYLRMNMVKTEDGQWVYQHELARREQEAKWAADGWKMQQDMVWVAPEEQGKWADGLFKCDDRWLDLEGANEYHSDLNTCWTLPTPGGNFILYSTCPWAWTEWAAYHADATVPLLKRAYGVWPKHRRPVVAVANSVDQYGVFAGRQGTNWPATEVEGTSSIHHAFFAESWFNQNPRYYLGSGACYIDVANTNGSAEQFGQMAVRHAAALSYAEAIDPSPETVSRAFGSPSQQLQAPAFWDEKRIPRWFRYGVAAWVERFYVDTSPPDGFGPTWIRDWAVKEVEKRGGCRPLEQVFAFNFTVTNPTDSFKLMMEAGMLVSFIMDGKCDPVRDAHDAFKKALRDGEDTDAAIQELQRAILDNEEKYHLHIGI